MRRADGMTRLGTSCVAALVLASGAAAQDTTVWHALALEDSARWEEAAVIYRRALDSPERVHAAFGLERALLTLGRPEELAEALSWLVIEVPNEPLFRAMYVRTLLGLERREGARAFVERWMADQPTEPEAYRQLYAVGPLTAADARAAWRRVRARGFADSAQVIVDELTGRVLESGLWATAREILEERYARGQDPIIGEQLALAAARAGEVDRARAVARATGLSEESAATAWLALYEGDLVTARRLLRRADESDPAAVMPLAVLSRTTVAQSRDFGEGVLRLVRGDSAGAARAFARAAPDIPDAASALLAWSARITAARGDHAAADRLYDAIVRDYPASPEAPEAVLAQARSLLRGGLPGEATARLESLILTYPRSALVPAARRELDVLRGAIPAERD